jgi:hypothetical protein
VINRALVRLNNLAVRLRRPRCRPGELLVLFSHCLHRSGCDSKVGEDLSNCRRCGRCAVARFLDLAEAYGVRLYMAAGGREAGVQASRPDVKAVVAVACDRELRDGVLAALPKAVLATEIAWPRGPCKDTTVDFRQVEEAVRWFLR